MGITCAGVGGLWDASTSSYYGAGTSSDASPCTDPASSPPILQPPPPPQHFLPPSPPPPSCLCGKFNVGDLVSPCSGVTWAVSSGTAAQSPMDKTCKAIGMRDGEVALECIDYNEGADGPGFCPGFDGTCGGTCDSADTNRKYWSVPCEQACSPPPSPPLPLPPGLPAHLAAPEAISFTYYRGTDCTGEVIHEASNLMPGTAYQLPTSFVQTHAGDLVQSPYRVFYGWVFTSRASSAGSGKDLFFCHTQDTTTRPAGSPEPSEAEMMSMLALGSSEAIIARLIQAQPYTGKGCIQPQLLACLPGYAGLSFKIDDVSSGGGASLHPPSPPALYVATMAMIASGSPEDYGAAWKSEFKSKAAAKLSVSENSVAVSVTASSVKIQLDVSYATESAASAGASTLQTAASTPADASSFLSTASAAVTVTSIAVAPKTQAVSSASSGGSSSSASSSDGGGMGIVIGAAGGGGALVALIVISFLCCRKTKVPANRRSPSPLHPLTCSSAYLLLLLLLHLLHLLPSSLLSPPSS